MRSFRFHMHMIYLCPKTMVEEVIWAKNFIEEFGFHQDKIKFGQDNKSCMIISTNGPGRMGRTKHLNVRHYFITQFIDDGNIELIYIPSKDLIADGLTKPLCKSDFVKWRQKILNLDSQCDME